MTPAANDTPSTSGVQSIADNVEVSFNHIHDVTGVAVLVTGAVAAANPLINGNTITNSTSGIICTCTNGQIYNNFVNPLTDPNGYGISLQNGSGTVVSTNFLTGAQLDIESNISTVQDNTLDGQNANLNLVELAGNQIIFQENYLENTQNVAVTIHSSPFANTVTNTFVKVYRNTFTNVWSGIWLWDTNPSDGYIVDALIGGSNANANVFLPPAFSTDLELVSVPHNINAEYNNWGFCDPADIEGKIYHNPDDASLGTVDFEPFINPDPCPTASPTPTPTHSPTPIHSLTPSATPTNTLHVKQGDLNCDGAVTSADAFGPLDFLEDLTFGLHIPCVDLGTSVHVAGVARDWGDVNCSDGIGVDDALALLASVSSVPYERGAGCPQIGQSITVTVP
jgi:hypothetical protein